MKIEIRLVMSMRLHGATCHLLILDNRTHVLLDCGINANFDFTQYRVHEKSLAKVEIILLTHPSLEYLGALPFLIDEFGMNPRVYSTQPVIILGPLNIH
jgi:cleavage and polyadenylation specificity factor subunit 2